MFRTFIITYYLLLQLRPSIDSSVTWQGWMRHLTSPEHSKRQSEVCP